MNHSLEFVKEPKLSEMKKKILYVPNMHENSLLNFICLNNIQAFKAHSYSHFRNYMTTFFLNAISIVSMNLINWYFVFRKFFYHINALFYALIRWLVLFYVKNFVFLMRKCIRYWYADLCGRNSRNLILVNPKFNHIICMDFFALILWWLIWDSGVLMHPL